jgi:RNA polymerase sigma-70 factor (ECF subfamily)
VTGSHARTASAEPDDRSLLAAHLAGDRDAFAELVHRHRDRLWAVAVRTMQDRDEAADALQEALISAFRRAGSYRGEAEVTTWLHRIVVNACLDRIRRRTVRAWQPLGERDPASPRDPQAEVDTRLAVRAALARLPAEQREALVLVDMEDLPVAEVARMLAVPEGTIKSRCSRGRTALAALLREPEPVQDVPAAGNRRRPPRVASAGIGSEDTPTQTGRQAGGRAT